MAKIILLSTVLFLALLAPPGSGVAAAQMAPFPVASGEYGFQLGYGTSHPGLGETRTRVQTVDFIGRYGYFLSGEIGSGWYRGQFQHVFELPLHLAVDPKTRIMTGGNLLAKWNLTGLSGARLLPYLFAGGGVLYVDLGLPGMGSRLDFSYGGGTGVQYFLKPDLAVSAEYRYHHISNANTAQPNEPLNSSKFLVGISAFR